MPNTQPLFEIWPGYGRDTVVQSGGTRNSVKLSRPWQTVIPVTKKCPFCTKSERTIASYPEDGGWRVLNAVFSSHIFHRLIIPEKCWLVEELYSLGGTSQIEVPLRAVFDIISQENISMLWGVHIGCLAGQTISHLHYHAIDKPFASDDGFRTQEKLCAIFSQRKELIVYESERIFVGVGGGRTGQGFFVPKKLLLCDASSVPEIAHTVACIVNLYCKRFRSTEGLPPEFTVGMRFSPTRGLAYGLYIPVLSHWGFVQAMSSLEGDPILLAWSHEATAAHLLSRME